MKVEVYKKDIDIIEQFAADLHCPTPLFEASKPFYAAALAQGRALEDTAAVCAVLEQMAGVKRKPRPKSEPLQPERERRDETHHVTAEPGCADHFPQHEAGVP